jgi:argininosuccinate lyase
VIAGRYIRQAIDRGLAPAAPDGSLLAEIAAGLGYPVKQPAELLTATLGVDAGLRAKRSDGSTHPEAVAAMLAAQDKEFAALAEQWALRRRAVTAAASRVDTLLRPQVLKWP